MRFFIILQLVLMAISSTPSYAQVDADFSNGGGMLMGWSSSACAAGLAGSVRYNSANSGSLDLCNSTSWKSVAGGSLDGLSDAFTNYTKYNMILGHEAPLLSATTAANTSLGVEAFDSYTHTTGAYTAIGYKALTALTGGYGGFTAVGAEAMLSQQDALGNSALGYRAGSSSGAVDHMVAVGYRALVNNANHYAVCAGSDCLSSCGGCYKTIGLGNNAGSNLTGGSNNIFIGAATVSPTAGINNYLNIGGLISGDMSANKYVGINKPSPAYNLDIVGNIAFTGVATDISDQRRKENIQPLPHATPQILSLRPVSYTMKDDGQHKQEFGFIAQDVEKIFPELIGVADDAARTKSLNYTGLIAPLVKALQERELLIQQREARIQKLESLLQ